ncbi:hypothetical protein COL8621_02955 [Actibacterium lipolyticum]|uniref:Transposase n=1 Tax=Actibacterium lipolyticum TaxID=1524263 RepID=A0A238KTL4_9RHOB|nr:hypothetical protein COL8621_02955 [Actibacterium lipolyticum]
MKKSGFSKEQIIGIQKEHQARLGAKELCRKHGISDAAGSIPNQHPLELKFGADVRQLSKTIR